MIGVENRIPRPDVLLGLIRAEGADVAGASEAFEGRLSALLDHRASALSPEEEKVRTSVREMLRNGRYKPTGRAKPASEYLLRAAGPEGDSAFPRINLPVDVCNYVSLKYLVPISLWDLDLAGTDRFLFRLGRAGESYVFNRGGQEIDVEDLLVGCRVAGETDGEPIVNPVKDSLATKTTPETRRVAACIYAPADSVPRSELEAICVEFAELLAMVSGETRWSVAAAGEAVRF